jgi:NADH:quinone reductase (non-electrogenic)
MVRDLSLQLSLHRRALVLISPRVGVPQLAAAVSEAGGLGAFFTASDSNVSVPGHVVSEPRGTGILTALTQPSPDALRHAIRETKRLTPKPFGVNITILPSINPPDYAGYARAAVEEGVKIFETAGNNRMSSLLHLFSREDRRC